MVAWNRHTRFTLWSLVLFIVCCGLFAGAGMRLWRFYKPRLSAGAGARTPRLTEASFERLFKDVQSPSVQTRLAAATELRSFWLDADEALPLLDQLLRDESHEVRVQAIQSIASFGEAARDRVPSLITVLEDDNSVVRQQAAMALGRMGAIAAEAVPNLIKLMDDETSRGEAIRAIGRIGPPAALAVHALVAALDDADLTVRHDAMLALINLETAAAPAVSALVAHLESAEPLIVERAAMALGRIGASAKEAVPALIGVANRDARVRDAAIQALNLIDEADVSMLPAIGEAMASDFTRLQIAAVQLVRKIGPPGAPVLPDLVALLASVETKEIATVARALKQIGLESIPALCQALKSDDSRHRATAACVIAIFGEESRGAVPDLTGALADEVPRVRAAAAMALGIIGPDARDAIPALRRLLKEQDPLVRRNAALAIGNIATSDEETVRELLALTADPDANVRSSALWSLGALHTVPDLVVPTLIELLKTPVQDSDLVPVLEAVAAYGDQAQAAIEPVVRLIRRPGNLQSHAFAATALGEIGLNADGCVPVLVECLSRTDFYAYESVARALHKLDQDAARRTIPGLVLRLGQSELFEHEYLMILRALAQFGPDAGEAVPALIAMLAEQDFDKRGEIAYTLGKIGPAAAAAVPVLIDSYQSTHNKPDYKSHYIEAFGQIGPPASDAVPLLIRMLAPSLTEWEVASLLSEPTPDIASAIWESRAKRAARSLGLIGSGAYQAVPALTALAQSTYVPKTIVVPAPELHLRLAGLGLRFFELQEMHKKSVQETASEALERIQAARNEQHQ